jgi:hypothetical protein
MMDAFGAKSSDRNGFINDDSSGGGGVVVE